MKHGPPLLKMSPLGERCADDKGAARGPRVVGYWPLADIDACTAHVRF